jgi:GT2 family glycosyltransferase
MMKSDLITFIDDDIGIEREFLTSTRGFFEMNPKIVGSAPLIKSLYGFKTPNELTDKISHKKLMKNSGKVTPSGNNFWFLDNQSDVLQTAEWLPGCCMTYRTSKIKSIQFSTHLQNGPTGGYALGEDVDFSLRAAGLGSLMLDSKTIISHLQALSIRDDRLVMASGLGRWLAYASRNFPAQVSILRVSVRLLLQILRDLLRLGCLKKGSLMDLKVATFTFKSFLKELFFPKLVSN